MCLMVALLASLSIVAVYACRYLVAAGLESGEIVLSAWNVSEGFKILQTLDTRYA